MAHVKFDDSERIHKADNEFAIWEIHAGEAEGGKYYRAVVKSKPGVPEFSYTLRGADMERVFFSSRGIFLGYTVGCGSQDVGLSYSETF